MAASNDTRFIKSVASFDYVLSDLDWDLSKNSATPFSDFFGLPMVSRTASTTQLNTDWPTPLSSFMYIPMISRRRPKAGLATGMCILSRRGKRLGTGKRYLSLR